MKIATEFPFDEYYGYTQINKQNRTMLLLKHKETGKRTTISYARYLMSVHLKRVLAADEHVDHVDEDKTNDVISNLQILSPKENKRKNIRQQGLTEKHVQLKCPNCQCVFEKPLRQSFLGKGGLFSCCSKKCLFLFSCGEKRQREELAIIGKKQIVKFFRKTA